MDEDGYYSHWEYDNDPSVMTKIMEIQIVMVKRLNRLQKLEPVNESRTIKENESPDENELVDGIRGILSKQRKAHSEDVWYSDITKLLKRLNIPLKG